MYVLVGASSFIGVHTAQELFDHNCDFVVAGRNEKFKTHYENLGIEYIDFDLAVEDDCKKLPTADVEGIVLLAGLLPANATVNLDEEENAAEYFKINTLGTINILEHCRQNRIGKVLSTSSYADVICSWSKATALTEEEPRSYLFSGDHAVYVLSKNAMTDVMEYYNQQHGMNNTVFRLPPVLGVGPHGTLRVNGKVQKSGLQIFIENASTGRPITVYGDRFLSRDVVYVKDVAQAIRLALQSKKASGLYNIAAGRGVTLQEQAEVISRVFAPNPDQVSEIIYDPSVPNNGKSFLFSIDKAQRDFGYTPVFADFEKMMNDYKQSLDQELFRNLFHY